MKIVGVSGQTKSGKDTVADILADKFGFVKVALADPMKRYARDVFGFTEEDLWGPSENRNKKTPLTLSTSSKIVINSLTANSSLLNEVLPHCTEDLIGTQTHFGELVQRSLESWVAETISLPAISPRIVLQCLGTEWGRALHKDIWINYVVNVAKKLDTGMYTYSATEGLHPCIQTRIRPLAGVVVSDVRFANELDTIKRHNGFVVRVQRPDTDGDAAGVGVEGHLSEREQKSFSNDSFNYVIHNDKDLQHLLNESYKVGTILTGGILPKP